MQVCRQLASRIRMELQFLCPLSGVFHCTQQWYMSYRFVDSFWVGSGWNCSSSVHHQEFFTVHIAMVYVIQVCRQLLSEIRMEMQFLCPSSGVFHCTHSNGICHTGLQTTCEQDQIGTAVPLSIIRSFSLYTQQWYMSYRFADNLRAGSGWNCSSSVHHQEFFTVHTAMVYVIQVCRQLASRIRMELQFLCPSSGVFHCTHSNGICHTGL